MFYDNFDKNDICGIFTLGHFVALAIFFATIILAIYLSKNFDKNKMKKVMLIIAILVSVMEIIKIAIRIYKQPFSYDSYLPFYFCSIFLFAIWLCLCENKTLQNAGFAFVTMGGIVASICFAVYPSTSLLLYPLWHPASMHSLFYHWLMLYTGIMVIKTKLYVPNIKHFWNYFALMSAFCVVALILNIKLDTNLMFLSDPFGLDFLQKIIDVSPWLYAFWAYITQSVLVYFLSYGLYRFCVFAHCKFEQNRGAQKVETRE